MNDFENLYLASDLGLMREQTNKNAEIIGTSMVSGSPALLPSLQLNINRCMNRIGDLQV